MSIKTSAITKPGIDPFVTFSGEKKTNVEKYIPDLSSEAFLTGKKIDSSQLDAIDFKMLREQKQYFLKEIETLAFSRNYKEMKEKLTIHSSPLFHEKFFSEVLLKIEDTSLQIEIIKELCESEETHPYLVYIQNKDPYFIEFLLEIGSPSSELLAPLYGPLGKEKIQEEMSCLPKDSFLIQYLIQKGVLSREGELLRPARAVKQALLFLPPLLKLEKEEIERECRKIPLPYRPFDLILWSEAIANLVWDRFLKLSETTLKDINKELFWMRSLSDIKNGKKTTIEQKIRKSKEVLSSVKGYPGIQRLKESLDLTANKMGLVSEAFLSGPLRELELGLVFDPKAPFLEQIEDKKALERLYVKVLLDLLKTQEIPVNAYALYQGVDREDFKELERYSAKIPLEERQRALQEKIKTLYEAFFSEEAPNQTSDYKIFHSFKKAWNLFYQEIENQDPLVERAYLNLDVFSLLALKKKKEPILPDVPLSDLLDCFSEFKPEETPFFDFITMESYENWRNLECNKQSYLKNYLDRFFYSKVNTEEGNEEELLFDLHAARDVLISFLQSEAKSIRVEVKASFSSLEELEQEIEEIAYKKFLFWLDLFRKKYEHHPFLNELQEISLKELSTREKRNETHRFLNQGEFDRIDPNHVKKLKECILFFSPDFYKSKDVLQAHPYFEQQEGKDWIRKRSLGEILAFSNELFKEVFDLDLLASYSFLIKDAFKIPDLNLLDRVQNQVIYARFFHAVSKLAQNGIEFDRASIEDMKAQIKGLPIKEKIEKIKEYLRQLPPKKVSEYLLFQLEKPYVEPLSFSPEQLIELRLNIESYLSHRENEKKPFYRFLQEHHFSTLIWNEEIASYFYGFYDRFIEEQIEKSQIQNRSPEIYKKELSSIGHFNLRKLDQIAELLEKGKTLDLKRCIKLGFNLGVELNLMSLSLRPIQEMRREINTVFSTLSTFSTQFELLRHLEVDTAIFFDLFNKGNQKTKGVMFAYLKQQIEKLSLEEEVFLKSVVENYFGLPSVEIDKYSEEQKASLDELSRLEKWLQREGDDSALGKLLKKEGLLDASGNIKIEIYPAYTLKTIKNHISFAQIFADIRGTKPLSRHDRNTNAKKHLQLDAALSILWYEEFLSHLEENSVLKNRCLELYQARESSWAFVLQETKRLIEENEEGVSKTLLEDCFDELFSCPRTNPEHPFTVKRSLSKESSLSLFLEKIGFRWQEHENINLQYESYLIALQSFYRAYIHLKTHLQEKRGSDSLLYYQDLKETTKSLDFFLRPGNEIRLSDLADRLVYLEYQEALSTMRGSNSSKANKIRQKASKEEGTVLEMIEKAKEGLHVLGLNPQDEETLRQILNRSQWMQAWERKIERKWGDFLNSSLIDNLSLSPSERSSYEKFQILEKVSTFLGKRLSEELDKLPMKPMYKKLVEQAYYRQDFSFLDWLFLEISYERYKNALSKCEGIDETLLDALYRMDCDLNGSLIEEKRQKTLDFLQEHQLQELFDLLSFKELKQLL